MRVATDVRDPRKDPRPGDVFKFGMFRTVRAVVTRRTPKTVVLQIKGHERVERHRLDSFTARVWEVMYVAD